MKSIATSHLTTGQRASDGRCERSRAGYDEEQGKQDVHVEHQQPPDVVLHLDTSMGRPVIALCITAIRLARSLAVSGRLVAAAACSALRMYAARLDADSLHFTCAPHQVDADTGALRSLRPGNACTLPSPCTLRARLS